MNRPWKLQRALCLIGLAFFSFGIGGAAAEDKPAFQEVQFPSSDGVPITGDLYQSHAEKKTPFILLCHQAGWSRGEYREIAPKLNALGFNCLAIDQRSGGAVNGVANKTTAAAKKAKKGTNFVDARVDIVAALQHCRKDLAKGKLILWGSSYSSALALQIVGSNPKLADGVLSFAPGEYFVRFGKPADYVGSAAKQLKGRPVFVTSAKAEKPQWFGFYEQIPSKAKSYFLPKTAGQHGSRALWEKFPDHGEYWKAVTKFLNDHFPRQQPK